MSDSDDLKAADGVSAGAAEKLAGEVEDRAALLAGEHAAPHDLLGPHPAMLEDATGTVVRVFDPTARGGLLRRDGDDGVPLRSVGDGFFVAWLAGVAAPADGWPLDYRLDLEGAAGESWARDDPYRFPPTIGEVDLYLFGEGTHLRLWQCLGARPIEHAGVDGYAFAVWAPNARRVSLVGDFCDWDGRRLPLRRLGESGVFELFVPGLGDGELYKYEIVTSEGNVQLKADPLARYAELPPGTASRTFRSDYRWGDDDWLTAMARRDPSRRPLAAYEVHLGSFMSATSRPPAAEPEGAASPGYRELARAVVAHVKELGFDHVELLPVAEHPFHGSWGYQITGYYAATARYGDPDDLRYFVDLCHQNGIGVIVDWVPAHFVKDAHGLGRFDGTALFEHEDPRRGSHPDWGTYIFNYARFEVRSFLLSNALFWLEEMHVDGLRIDAVASMLYLDYSREEGDWLPNDDGGRENREAISLLQAVNRAIAERYPGRFTIAEESTAWPDVTRAVDEGGLGFTFKWNMGWMHDTLGYFSADPYFRSGCHDQLTFAMVYEHSERFVNPLSHDEVVHGKGSLYGKMPGDAWRKLANLRTLFAYQMTRPGKKLLFMGSELASPREWNHETALDWYLLGDPARRGLSHLVGELGRLYQNHPCLWRSDPDPGGFRWISCEDRRRSVVAYERRLVDGKSAGPKPEHLVIVLNLTPVPRDGYRIGAPRRGRYRLLLSTDEERFGGSGYETATEVATEDEPCDDHDASMVLTLPPLAALVLAPRPRRKKERSH